jgi:hypothetical protein
MNMKMHRSLSILLWGTLILMTSAACTAPANQVISLASFSENSVAVSISLEREPGGNVFLSGTFTPPDGYHLYSKDIPLHGVQGLGRPTLLELTTNSRITALGSLMESVKVQAPDFEPKELLVYPTGKVTLSLPIKLPPGDGWIDAEVKITYMACGAALCKPPVEGKIVPIHIPGADLLGKQ